MNSYGEMVMAEREALWRLMMETKFDSMRGGWCSKEVMGPFGVGVWTYIRRFQALRVTSSNKIARG
jgi:hypothetical protein